MWLFVNIQVGLEAVHPIKISVLNSLSLKKNLRIGFQVKAVNVHMRGTVSRSQLSKLQLSWLP